MYMKQLNLQLFEYLPLGGGGGGGRTSFLRNWLNNLFSESESSKQDGDQLGSFAFHKSTC